MKPLYECLWCESWGTLQKLGPVHRHIREDLVQCLIPLDIKSILDVGCGSGETLSTLASADLWKIAGCDVSAEAVKLAKRKIQCEAVCQLDIEKETLPEQFDAVVSIQVLEHLLDDIQALKNMAKMSRKYVILSTIGGKMRPSEVHIGHVRNYSTVELQRKIELAGMNIILIKCWGFPFYSPIFRTISEWFPETFPLNITRKGRRILTHLLYYAYKCNWPGRGDILWVIAQVRP